MKEFTGYIKGINLGGWLSQCSYQKEHYETFISEEDIKEIAGWGCDHIRLPFDYELVCTNEGNFLEEGFEYINRCMKWCEKYNLNMILDLHKTAGYSFDVKGNTFFNDKKLQDDFVNLWEEVSKRYGKDYEHLCFELLNEVVDEKDADTWNRIIKRTMPVIRANAPYIKVLVGGAQNNSVFCVKQLEQPYDENMVYTFHFYEPLIFTHQSAYWIDGMPTDFHTEYPNSYHNYLEESKSYLPEINHFIYGVVKTQEVNQEFIEKAFDEALKVAEERNVPIYCGEYGVIDRAPLASTINWYTDMNAVFKKRGIARAAWTYRGKDFGIVDEHYSEIKAKIIELL